MSPARQTYGPTRREVSALGAASVLTLFGLTGRADAAYPDRPVTMVVPFAAGGAIDIVARALGDSLGRSLRQSIVIENRPGAGGNIGVAFAARAKPDGYTMLMGSSSFAINPSLYARIAYDPFKDFVPVADLGFYPCVIVTRNDLGVRTLADLVVLAKAHPGKLNFATPGTGTVPHLAAELLKLRAGIDMVHIPYPGGGQAVQSLISGTVEVASLAAPQAVPQVQAGRITGLALTGSERAPELPDLPTLVEAGLAGAVAQTWQGLFTPTGTPDAIVDRVALETIAVLRQPEVIERFRQVGLTITGKGPDALRARLAQEVPRWKEVIEKAGIKAK